MRANKQTKKNIIACRTLKIMIIAGKAKKDWLTPASRFEARFVKQCKKFFYEKEDKFATGRFKKNSLRRCILHYQTPAEFDKWFISFGQ